MAEQWLPIPGWEGLYEVSDQGRVLSVKRKIIRKLKPDRGYLRIHLSKGGVTRQFGVHQLVLMAFVGPCPEGMEGRHKDGNRANNCLDNLEWATHLTNIHDKRQHADPAAHHPSTHCAGGHKWTPDTEYNFVRPDGRKERHCRKCRRDRWREKHGKTGRLNSTRYNPDRIA